MTKSVFKGYLFEIIVLRLVLNSGYHLINPNDAKIRINRTRFLEYKGRGEYHQIDIPCDSDYDIDFMYPVRLLGEAKAYERRVTKDVIRYEIGKMKDIQENYFVDGNLSLDMLKSRRTEVFAVFSLNGFNTEAEKLAYAHNIKTISFNGNTVLEPINEVMDSISNWAVEFKKEDQDSILDSFYKALIGNNTIDEGELITDIKEKYYFYMDRLINSIDKVKESIIAKAKVTGAILYLASNKEINFRRLFRFGDTINTRITGSNKEYREISFEIEDPTICFSLPNNLSNNKDMKKLKNEYDYEVISFTRIIDGIERHLNIRIDFNQLYNL